MQLYTLQVTVNLRDLMETDEETGVAEWVEFDLTNEDGEQVDQVGAITNHSFLLSNIHSLFNHARCCQLLHAKHSLFIPLFLLPFPC
jgi:hypothetical protein